MDEVNWEVQDESNAEYVGCIEIEDNTGEFHIFEVSVNETVLIFGSCTNTGLLQSGYMPLDDCFSLDTNLQELIANLECYYNDGTHSASGIIVNDRM